MARAGTHVANLGWWSAFAAPGRSSRVASLLLGAAVLSLVPEQALAQSSDWIGVTSTDWFTATNWSNGVPTATNFGNIDTTAPNATEVGAPGAQVPGLLVGNFGSGTLTIQNGGTLSSGAVTLGNNTGSIGIVTLDGAASSWTNSGIVFVGRSGTGTLTIRNGGKLNSSGVSTIFGGILGDASGSSGAVTVDGAQSSWTNFALLAVGGSGTGSLTISNGGAVSSVRTFVGLNSGSSGNATVDGIGSTWTASGGLFEFFTVGYGAPAR